MAGGKFKLYDLAKKRIGDGTIDLDTNPIKALLFASTSNCNTLSVGTGLLADLTNQLATANGYTAGGQALTSVTWANSAGTITLDAADPVWSATGTLAARFLVLVQSGTFNGVTDALIAVMLLDTTPADVSVTAGNTLTIVLNASGIFTLSGATTD